MLLDAGKELGLLLGHLALPLAVAQPKHLAADAGPGEPAEGGKREGGQAKGDDGVEGNLLGNELPRAGHEGHGAREAAKQAAGDGEDELDAAALEAQVEEGVPVEGGVTVGGGGARCL